MHSKLPGIPRRRQMTFPGGQLHIIRVKTPLSQPTSARLIPWVPHKTTAVMSRENSFASVGRKLRSNVARPHPWHLEQWNYSRAMDGRAPSTTIHQNRVSDVLSQPLRRQTAAAKALPFRNIIRRLPLHAFPIRRCGRRTARAAARIHHAPPEPEALPMGHEAHCRTTCLGKTRPSSIHHPSRRPAGISGHHISSTSYHLLSRNFLACWT